MNNPNPQSMTGFTGMKTAIDAVAALDSVLREQLSPVESPLSDSSLSGLTTNSGSTSSADIQAAAEQLDAVDFETVDLVRLYEIGEVIGKGGMGIVYRAVERQSRHPLAIKRLKPDLVTNPRALARFQAEGHAMLKLTHENIVRFFRMGRDATSPFYVMELIEGGSLADRLRHGKLDFDKAIQMFVALASGLSHSHRHRIIHRDIKPGNILLTTDRIAKLTDFGLAREIDGIGMTSTSVVMGTPYYMSPEQQRGAKFATEQSDLYSLAATFYHALTGDAPVAIRDQRLPEPVRELTMRALEPDPALRQKTVTEFANELRSVLMRLDASAQLKRSETRLPDSNVFTGRSAGDAKEFVPGMRFRWCPPGTFTMGTPEAADNESPVSVTLSQGFWMGETVVTQGQWQARMKSTPWKDKEWVKEGPDYPASYISHGDAGDGKLGADSASDFCEPLTEQERKAGRLPAGWKYSLPTEAQWEYACRAGTSTTFSFGDNENRLGDYGWFVKNAYSVSESYAHGVGLKQPNGWGLLDMHGNLWEWCLDWYLKKLPGGCDPMVRSGGAGRVIRGGCWGNSVAYCRAARRGGYLPAYRGNDVGFRVCLSSCEPRYDGVHKRERSL